MGAISSLTIDKLAKMIDHTLLDPSSTYSKLERLCNEAVKYGFGAVCINPVHVSLASKLLKSTAVKVCSVIGFPFGATPTKVKVFETRCVIEDGVEEVDMVINIGALRSGDYVRVRNDIDAVVEAASGSVVKVIIETGYLTDEEKVKACQLAKEARAHFVKTSTGFGPFGAFPSDVKLMRRVVGSKMGVKAAGGIKDFNDALRLIRAGANRLGTSASVSIIEGFEWAKYSKAWFIEEIPCKICPSRHSNLTKQPKEVYRYYKSKCRTCPDRKYNVFYEK